MSILLHVIVFLGTAVFWEFVAWFMHRYVMHGFGWFLHEDHHRKTGKKLQKNDAYAVFFALCSFLLIYGGLSVGNTLSAAAGFGVALYGIGYVLFHDIMFHKRLKNFRLPVRGRYFKHIVASHRIHHSVVTKEGATNFSFLWASRRSVPGEE